MPISKEQIETLKKPLLEKIQKAVELEWSTIPPYLLAYYSLRRDKNRAAAGTIKSVFMEEMLHLVLAANLLTALGGKARLGPHNLPTYPLRMEFHGKEFGDRQFDIDLASFSEAAIDIFLQIEFPQQLARATTLETFVVEGFTIGQFYTSIKDDLKSLCAQAGDEKLVFTGEEAHQIPEDYYWGGGGGIIKVKSLDTALAAMDLIIDQGEGTPGSLNDPDGDFFAEPTEVAHYFRFNEIRQKQRYAAGDRPTDPPSGPAMEVDYDAVYVVKPNCKAADFKDDPTLAMLNDRFNSAYTLMLRQLEEAFGGNPQVLYVAIMDGMHGLADLAVAIMQIPVPNDPQQRRAAPTFEWVGNPSSEAKVAPAAALPATPPPAPPALASLRAESIPFAETVTAALEEVQRTADEPYYDSAAETAAIDAYYTGIDWTASGEALYQQLSAKLTSTHTTRPRYKPSMELYPWVDLQEDRQIKSIYSGVTASPEEFIQLDAEVQEARQQQLNNFVALNGFAFEALAPALERLEDALPYNCEHSVPQSWFNKKEPMRGDLHHLFACESRCNSLRGNLPYYDAPPSPADGATDCGQVFADGFEPTGGKGAVARATLYFLLRYPGVIGDVGRELQESRLPTLLSWHAAYPPGRYEKHRNAAIFQRQGNRNPLIDFPQHATKIAFRLGFGHP